ncbi:AAA family ATPase [Actinoplanes sp. NEAU-A12]|uniref:AAA family ATPase n=1 Tax=Actinoplanes sandaracinus TaxID=3045177 RepID=A0ABT6WXH5_9ACTN|nr:AAA family ATPase [Actinoplanes sandaracinus]MDI6104442.1 AAA family ATPase [Actinoplanes sandaracinus]
MYIKEIGIADVRGFHGARTFVLDLGRPDGSLAGWTVIAGRNGSGKTSLLRAVALALGGQGVAHNLVADFASWISADAQAAHSFVRLELDPEADRFDGDFQPDSDTFRAGLAWFGKQAEAVHRPDDQPLLVPLRFGAERGQHDLESQTAKHGPWSNNPVGWFCAAYGPFRRLAGGSPDAHRLMTSRAPAARMASLFHEDASLAEGVSWLIEQHLRALEGRPGAEDLKRVALAVLGNGLLPDGYQVERVDSEGLWVARGEHRFALREMSDGYRVVVALVVDLLKQIHDAYGGLRAEERGGSVMINAPGVVLIDEVDAHLHVSWQKRIGGWLKEHFPRIQFIVTTHSPYICQAADANGLIRLPGPDEDVPPRIVDRDLYERVVYGSGDDAVMSELFGLDTPYSDEAVRLRRQLVALETDVLTGRANDETVRRYEELRGRLTSSPTARVEELAARLASDAE